MTRGLIIKLTLLYFAIIVCAAFWAWDAWAHELWQNGDPIPAWVKSSCCGPADAHNLPDSDVFVSRAGYLVAGRAQPIPFDKVTPSPDGTYWIFYTGDINTATIFCMFAPHSGT